MEYVDKFIESLASQSPAAVAVIIIVGYFLRALKDRDILFSRTLLERDRLFTSSLEKHDQLFSQTIEKLTLGINSVQDSLILLDQDARDKMGLKPKRRKPKSPG